MQVTKEVTDGAGYGVRQEDLAFLGLTYESLENLASRAAPLGMMPDDYDFMCHVLDRALSREGIKDADVRLQGSSAHFFSSWHKRMPYQLRDIAQIVRERTGRLPEARECRPFLTVIDEQWPKTAPRPVRRPFDSMHRVELGSRSDYDVQISSDQMMSRVLEEIAEYGYEPDEIRATDVNYGFVLKDLTEVIFPHVGLACGRISVRTGRSATWALFSSTGPERNERDFNLSSHHKASDWIISQPPILSADGNP